MPESSKVIVCPLDWGLGHASRMIPVINRFIACGYSVILGGSGKSGELLQKTFPDLLYVTISSKVIRYSKSRLIFSLLLQIPGMVFSAFREHFILNKIVKQYNIHVVVSDNRYGLYNKHTHNILVTHQISPTLPTWFRHFEYPLYLIIRTLIGSFDECWIPDYSDEHNLSGKLSHRFVLPRNARFIGILSRFGDVFDNTAAPKQPVYKMVIVLSGPQPELETFTRLVIKQTEHLSVKTLIITGLQEQFANVMDMESSNITIVSHLDRSEFRQVLQHADIIVCRAGYSGLMDLVALRKTAVLVPTPGQPEQEYLAKYLSGKGFFTYVKQDNLNLKVVALEFHQSKKDPKIFVGREQLDLPVQPYFTKKTTTITSNPNK